jgi:hypothetical protein
MWNAGALLRGSAIDANDPLRFKVPDGEIVAASVMKASSGRNVHTGLANGGYSDSVTIVFDELGKSEGAVIEILHTSSEPGGIVLGSLQGTPLNLQNRGRLRRPFNPLPSQVPTAFKAIGYTAFVLVFGIGALLVLLSAFRSPLAAVFGPHVEPTMNVIEGASDIIYAGLALILIAQTRRRFPEDLSIPELSD